MTTRLFAGLDVALEMTSVCVVDANGAMILEAKVVSDPFDIYEVLTGIDGSFERVGFEAGPLSQWLYNGLIAAGLPAVCIEARHAKAAMVAMNRNKNDRNDARPTGPACPFGLVQVRPREVDGEPGDAHAPHVTRVLCQQAARP